MAKISVVLLMFFSLFIISNGKEHNVDQELWLQNVCQGKEKVSKLHFYIQDVLSGPNATVWEVARSLLTGNSSTSFGQVRVIDDLITSKPDRNSKKLGRVQGLITFADLEESALNMNLNFIFIQGKYNGSSLSILGRNPILHTDRELPVVGGTGVFRMARGYCISNTYSYDVETNYGVLEYTIYVSYVDSSSVHHAAS